MALLFTLPRSNQFDAVGELMSGWTVEFYSTGSSTPRTVYADSALTTPLGVSVQAGDDGSLRPIYLDDSGLAYKILIKDSNGEIVPNGTIDPYLVGPSQSQIARALYPRNAAEIAADVTPVNYEFMPGNVLRYGTNAVPESTNMTAAFTAARAVTSGRYHIPRGSYLVDASPNVWLDAFTADGGTSIRIGATTHDVSNAYCGRLRFAIASASKTDIYDANTGDLIAYVQNISPGTAFGWYKGHAIQFNGHWAQVSPRTTGGSVDLLWQRAPDHASDAAGNRFNQTFEEPADRLVFSYATTASGAPTFNAFMICGAGTSPYLTFPGLLAQFQKGWSVKQTASGGFEITMEQTSSTVATLKQIGGSATTYMTFRDGAFGFFGSSGTSQQTISGSRGGNAALASLLTALANMGLIVDGTTA